MRVRRVALMMCALKSAQGGGRRAPVLPVGLW